MTTAPELTVLMPRVNVDDDLFAQTVPRFLVHRRAVSEVFATGLRQLPDGTHSVGIHLPRAHRYYAPRNGHHDPLILAEAVRQAGFVVAHLGYAVPYGWQFLMWELAVELTTDGLRLDGGPVELVLSVRASDQRYRSGRLAGMRMDFDCTRDGALIGRAHARFDVVNPATFARVRGHRRLSDGRDRPPTPVAAASVGRESSADVVLAPRADGSPGWLLRADQNHPVFFDHPVDHVPGSVLIEALRQCAHATLGRGALTVVGLLASFHRYVELDEPCEVRAEAAPVLAGGHVVDVEFRQTGELVASGHITVAP